MPRTRAWRLGGLPRGCVSVACAGGDEGQARGEAARAAGRVAQDARGHRAPSHASHRRHAIESNRPRIMGNRRRRA
eukprot:621149-Pleurochrysis_carterae.AAC.1